jgi:hypothetical protein
VTAVNFGGNPAGFTVVDDTTITASSPAIEGPDNETITVSSVGGTSSPGPNDVFTYTAASGVACSKVSGTAGGTVTFSKCTPSSSSDKKASASGLTGSLTWTPSGGTTVTSLSESSPGQGSCKKNSVEEDLYGSVVGGTSTYTATGDPVSASVCVASSGKVSLVKGTTFAL